jgi:hypothetical protein
VRSTRIPALIVLGGVLVGALVIERGLDDPDPGEPIDVAGVAMPATSPPGALSSTWYCAGGSAEEGGPADHIVVVANPGDEALEGRVTVLGGGVAAPPAGGPDADLEPPTADGADEGDDAAAEEGTDDADDADDADAAEDADGADDADAAEDADEAEDADDGADGGADVEEATPRFDPVVEDIEVPARGSVRLRLGDVLEAPLAGAVIEVDGGGVAAEHTVIGEAGRASAPCSTTASSTWTFPWGVTSRGNRELLVFMNPFPDDATLDIDLATDEGTRQVGRYDGFVVPARSVVGAYVDQDTRREHVSAHVRLRAGRVVVDRIQTFDGTDGREGMTLGLGAPTPAETWVFPDGYADEEEGITEQVVVFNPTERTSEVEVEVRLSGDDAEFVEPFALSVPAGRFATLDVHEDARLEPGEPHALFVRSVNGVPMVAERVLAFAEPAEQRGVTATLGSPLAATSWLLAAGGPTDQIDQRLTIVNLGGDAIATVTVTGLADGQPLAIADLQDLEVQPSGRTSVRLGDSGLTRAALPLLITSSEPIVVERALFTVDGLGASTTIAIPVGGTTLVPEPIASD